MDPEQNASGGGLGSFLESHPTVTIGGAIVAVLLLGAILLRKNTTPTSASSSPQDLSGLATDAAGNHVVYVPTSTSFTTINKSGDTTTTNNPPPPAPTPTPTPKPVTQTAFVRARYSSTLVKRWDDGHPQGVPIRATPGGNIVRYAAYGSQITIGGAATDGPGNTGATSGSMAWLPVQGGYISAFDVTGLQSSAHAGVGTGGARAMPVMAPAVPVLKWDMPYTAMPGHTLASIARHVSQIARQQGAPGNTLVTAQQLAKYNNVRQVSTGQTIIVPRWTTGGSYYA